MSCERLVVLAILQIWLCLVRALKQRDVFFENDIEYVKLQ